MPPARTGIAAILLILVLGAATAYLGYRQFFTSFNSDSPLPAIAQPARQVAEKTAGDTVSEGSLALEAKGYIIPARQVVVSPKVSGMIEELFIVEGQRVQKGTILAELEKTDYQADAERERARRDAAKQRYEELQRGFRTEEIEQARAELAEAQVQLDQATSDWQRSSTLWETRAVSKEEFDSARSQMLALERRVQRLTFALKLLQIGAREERIQAAAADVRQAEAELAKAEWRLGNCTIRAPITGTILKKNAEEGNIVNAVAFNVSFSICDMADLSDMEVELTVQERDIARLFAGQPCRIRPDAFPERVYAGRVSRIMPIADRAKGAIPVRVKIEIPPEEEGVYLKPEMGAVVAFLKEPAAAASPSALQNDRGLPQTGIDQSSPQPERNADG